MATADPPPPPPPSAARPAPRGTAPTDRSTTAAGPPGPPGTWQPLDGSIVTVWRVGLALGLLAPALATAVVGAMLLPTWRWVPATAAVMVVPFVVWWLPRARYRRWRWRLDELALDLEHGVIVRRRASVPYFRVQQIDVSRGPLARALGLAALDVTTASAAGSATLPGLTATLAPVVRHELLRRAGGSAGGTETDDAV